jgi:thiol-disulfide isomerase/thioredoxin
VGDTLPLGSVRLIDGQVIASEEWTKRFTVVQVWATWCPYCRAQNKVLQQLHHSVSPRQLNFLTISIDKTQGVVEKYIAENRYQFPVAMMTPALKDAIGKRKGVPELYVINPNGQVVFKAYGQLFDEDILELKRFAR